MNGFHHELIDRLYIIMDMYNDYIIEHNSDDILPKEEKEKAFKILWDQYQYVGGKMDEPEKPERTILTVKAYKPSGKWYSTQQTEIDIKSYGDVFALQQLIRINDPSVHKYSGLQGGFTKGFTYMLSLNHPDGSEYFMDDLLYSTDNEIRVASIKEEE